MGIFVNDLDAQRTAIRRWYADYLGPPFSGGRVPDDDPTIRAWVAVWNAHGAETVFDSIYNSDEAKHRRYVESLGPAPGPPR